MSALGEDTIAAISTPPGRGGIGIVRLSGPEAVRIATSLLDRKVALQHARAHFGRVLDLRTGEVMDEALVTAFVGPRSYTGEDVVEVATHGSPVILEAVLRGALVRGARLAEPGEFTQRAFVNGRLDLTQAEAVQDLIAARTVDQARQAAQQLGGALSRRLAPAKERLLHLMALLEAGMDFASGELDDVDVVAPEYIAAEIAGVTAEVERLLGTYQRGHLLRNGASLALVGRPNAGKSSVFNRLLERERAIVTALPGTTRDTVEESFSLDGIPLRLIDTAGLRGFADALDLPADEAEAMGIARSREALADADLVLVVHDATQGLTHGERVLLEELAGRPYVLVRNKVDLLGERDGGGMAVSTSAVTGEGFEELKAAILRHLHAEGGLGEAGVLTTERQFAALSGARAALEQAAAANASGMAHEALLLDLHAALGAVDSLTGVTTTEDILGRIFSTFCIGK